MKPHTLNPSENGFTMLYIKNMVCNRCIMVVDRILNDMRLSPVNVSLGTVCLAVTPTATQLTDLSQRLEAVGFSLLDDPRTQLIERIKNAIIRLVYHDDGALRENLSDYLTRMLPHEYSVLSKLFSESEGTTIEKYFIAQKIERVKELLSYGELSLSEIADKLHYSSTAHLSAQFKNVTGITSSSFRAQQQSHARKPLDEI